jgi:hypothetical protein
VDRVESLIFLLLECSHNSISCLFYHIIAIESILLVTLNGSTDKLSSMKEKA